MEIFDKEPFEKAIIAQYVKKFKEWIASLSYRTGIIVIVACIFFYIISFAQMLLPISVSAKGILWVIFFGLAKASQYTALLIIGKAGFDSIHKRLSRRSE